MAAILHMVLFKFPSIEGAVPQELAAVIAKFNELSGISAQFYPYGVGVEGLATKAAFLEAVAWPDKADGYTHCLIVLATGAPALMTSLPGCVAASPRRMPPSDLPQPSTNLVS